MEELTLLVGHKLTYLILKDSLSNNFIIYSLSNSVFKKRRGKFKCPLYYGPTDVNISIPEIKNLEPIPGAWIYFRIAYPNDDEYGKVSSLYPDHTMHEYIIPQIHLRNLHGAR